ncbi:hypothetical protein FRACYDRAFT_250087 [Fragilariopsis cylindrus CCMP1102]|uniref:Uncharacterized protein n=1 Tax=Fragilariopsis cylindrus CCMP1102 TaxID=635003 RepID=A0A1E7EQP9_9STRA|nr:hypothetical protein FRACYDRAFT_250087 [Fragilariopsis cylindrus CCMP1102]|eukprot:OEU08298.1 hypothetical protein FRACYDRAFT_250087 [Fragilariopsis cylindrus CCMP1102]
MDGSVTLQDFAASVNNYGSNMSNDDFKMDEEYQDEIDDERKLEEQDATVDDADRDSQEFGNNNPDLQVDYFQNPIHYYNKDTLNNYRTALIEDDLEANPGTNDIVNKDTTHDVEPGIPNELKSDGLLLGA